MILVIPFSGHSDYTRQLTQALKDQGGLGSHRLLVVSGSAHVSAANEFVEGLRDQFMFATLEHSKSADAPMVRLFRDGLLAAAATKFTQQEAPNAPVCWLTEGWVPTARDWLSTLAMSFFNLGGGARVMASWKKRPDVLVGNGAARHRVEDGYEPVGPVVFPHAYIHGNELIQRINEASNTWQHRIRYQVIPFMIDTPLLGEGPEAVVAPATKVEAKPQPKSAAKPQPKPAAEPKPTALPTPTIIPTAVIEPSAE